MRPRLAAQLRIFSAFAVCIFLSACASKQQLPPGDELEMEQQQGSADGEGKMLAPPPPPTAEEKAFAAAFDQKEEPEKKQQEPVTPMPEAQPQSDARADALEKFKQLFADSKRKVSAGKPDEAGLPELRTAADAAGSEAQQSALELSYKAAVAQKNGGDAEKFARDWLRACGPNAVDSCRRKAGSALARIPNATANQKKRLENLKENETCLAQSEASAKSGKLPPCFDSAVGYFRHDGDKLIVARLQLAKAIGELSKTPPSDAAAGALEKAEKACDEDRCVNIRRSALKSELRLAKANDDVEGAARAALRDQQLYASTLSASERLWARTPEADSACAALDAKSGAGSCRRLEKALTGRYAFKDFSKGAAKGEGLSPDAVREVNSHYGVTLETCLADAAARLTPPASESHSVRWTVGNDGKVTQVEMARKEQDQGPLGQCLREQFLVWRYPKYRGELQHVEQTFVINARERR
ncbi:MAG: hypothetical protein ACJ790_22540 [Myxococcaceae bacterium]